VEKPSKILVLYVIWSKYNEIYGESQLENAIAAQYNPNI
jgi:hypothetical protein